MGDERVTVSLAIRQAAPFEAPNEIVRKLQPTLFELVDPAPPVCAKHVEPEVERRVAPILSSDFDPVQNDDFRLHPEGSRGGRRRNDGAKKSVLRAEWAMCPQCVSASDRLRKRARVCWVIVAFLLAFFFLTIVLPEPLGLVGGLGVIAAIFVALGGMSFRQRSTFFMRGYLSKDGTEVLIPNAHKNFARLAGLQ